MEDKDGIITSFSQGVMIRKKDYVENARADGEQAKYYNKPGCSHTVTFVFVNVSKDVITDLDSRLKGYGDNIRVGELSITKECFLAQNCIVDNVEIGPKDWGIDNLDAGKMTYDVIANCEYTFTFRQLK